MKHKLFFLITIVSVVFIVVGALLFWIYRKNGADAGNSLSSVTLLNNESAETIVYYGGNRYEYDDNVSTFLVIGVDDNDNEDEEVLDDLNRNSGQSDFLMLVVFNNATKTYKIIQINRDTMTEIRCIDQDGNISGTITEQISLSHTFGSGEQDSCENTVYSVSRLLYDVNIDNYMSITMDVVPILNDIAGGVDVLVEDDFTGVDNTLTMGETVHLEGEHALIFIRARRQLVDDSNESRMRRQHVYLTALRTALKEKFLHDPTFAITAYNTISDYTVTDLNFYDIALLAFKLATYEYEGVITPSGEFIEDDRYMEFYVDDGELADLVIDLFYKPVDEA